MSDNILLERQTIGALATKEQQKASNPKDCVWVEASAGTGKTKILSDRVLRLLLQGVQPSKILALTYTKAAAVEMSERIYKRLSDWVSMTDEGIKKQLISLIGHELGDENVIKARRLFASILDAPINMRVQTIHAFCQEILKRFAFEAGISPYFEVIDDKTAKEISNNIKKEILNDENLKDTILYFAQNTSEDGFEKILKSIINNRLKLADNNKLKDLDVDLNPVFDVDMGGVDYAEFKKKYITLKNEVNKKLKKQEDIDIAHKIIDYEEKLKTLNLHQSSTAVYEIAKRFINKYDTYKKEHSLMDYDDLIYFTNKLLNNKGVSEWVLYKLDGGIDHILIDEAQDTSFNQWNIIRSITAEFFAQENNKTLFVVGDRKQSIYSFQGADVDNFDNIKKYFFAQNQNFKEINLSVSFRSTAPILENVNNVFKSQNLSHTPFRVGDCGEIQVWNVIFGDKKQKQDWQLLKERTKKESALQKLAKKIALKIKNMVENKEVLQSKNRAVKYQDFLILVKSRSGIVDALIKELKIHNVAVLGADRLKLLEQISIKDFLALAKFLLLPSDDLNLACVLKSPVFGLDDNDLFKLCYKRKNTLYNAIRDNDNYQNIYQILKTLLNMADYIRPFELFSYVLNNLDGRKKIIARLGLEAMDAVDEFLNMTIDFERDNIASLQGFVDWIESDDIELKRQLETGVDAVRIMTAHGSKGLQAPIVIMPDSIRMTKQKKEAKMLFDNGMLYPLSGDYYQQDANNIIEQLKKEEFFEYQRLLYVALTRAEDVLIVCGHSNTDKIPDDCWYSSVLNSISEIGVKNDDGWIYKNSQTLKVLKEEKEEKQSFSIEDTDFIYNKAKPITFDAKPYAPSKMGDDDAEFDLNPDNNKFAKGLAIHKILQHLKEFDKNKIDDFLKAYGLNLSLKKDILSLLENKNILELFEGNSKAEVAVCGKVGDKIINGVIDRLVVKEDEVLIVDYKTDKKTTEVPQKYKNQLGAYKSLLAEIYPTKEIKSYILWIQTAEMIEV